MTLAEQLGMRPLIAHCHAGLETLYRRIGKQLESGKQIQTATSMCTGRWRCSSGSRERKRRWWKGTIRAGRGNQH